MWASLQHYGLDTFSAYITDNCKLAHYMGECVDAKQEDCGISLAHPVVSNVRVFYLPDSCPLDPDTMASVLQCKSKVSAFFCCCFYLIPLRQENSLTYLPTHLHTYTLT